MRSTLHTNRCLLVLLPLALDCGTLSKPLKGTRAPDAAADMGQGRPDLQLDARDGSSAADANQAVDSFDVSESLLPPADAAPLADTHAQSTDTVDAPLSQTETPLDGNAGDKEASDRPSEADASIVDSSSDARIGSYDVGGLDITWPDTHQLVRDGGLCPILTTTEARCGAPACGNGVIDSCWLPIQMWGCGVPPGECPPAEISEDCDGAELGGASCVSRGYSGGTLACGATCWFDERACLTCAAGPHIATCKESLFCAHAGSLAMAGNDNAIVLAWVQGPPTQGDVYVASLAPDLSPRMTSSIVDITDGVSVAIARTPSGFMLAVERTTQEVDLVPLDDDGAVSGSVVSLVHASTPSLFGRGDGSSVTGGPLLTWSDGPSDSASAKAALLDETGGFVAAPITLASGTADTTAAFVDDGFLIAFSSYPVGLATRYVDLDGSLTSASNIDANGFTPQLAWLGDHAVMIYRYFAGSTNTASFLSLILDPLGHPSGSAVNIGTGDEIGATGPLAVLDTGSVAMLLTPASAVVNGGINTQLQLAFLASSGNIDKVVPLANDPEGCLASQVGHRGSDIIVAWLGRSVAGSRVDATPTTRTINVAVLLP